MNIKIYLKNLFISVSICFCISIILSNMRATAASEIESVENGYYIEETLTIESTDIKGISLYSTKQTKTATKTYTIKSSSGNVLAIYVLKGTFSYGAGASAKCTSATYSTSTKYSYSKFTNKTARASGNQAIGTFTLSTTVDGTTMKVSETVKITCAANGTIS